MNVYTHIANTRPKRPKGRFGEKQRGKQKNKGAHRSRGGRLKGRYEYAHRFNGFLWDPSFTYQFTSELATCLLACMFTCLNVY